MWARSKTELVRRLVVEGGGVNASETLAANEAIWSHYLRSRGRSWLDPLGLLGRSSVGREVSDANASRIAGFLSTIAAGPFAQLYDDKATAASGEGAAGLRT
jgi:hypothetical protein